MRKKENPKANKLWKEIGIVMSIIGGIFLIIGITGLFIGSSSLIFFNFLGIFFLFIGLGSLYYRFIYLVQSVNHDELITKICPNCKTHNDNDAIFCKRCGEKL